MSTVTTSTPDVNTNLRSWLILGLLAIVWGSSFILIKKGLVAFSAVQVGCLRMSFSALAFVPLLLAKWKKVDWSKLRYLIVVGLTGTAIPALLFATAQTQISSSLSGILNSLTPLFTLLLGILLFGTSFHWLKLLGVLLGLSGAALLIVLGSRSGLEGNVWYGLLVVLATICYAISGNTVGAHLREMNSLLIGAASFGLVGIPGLLYLLLGTDFVARLSAGPQAWESLGYIAILALVGTVAASVIFFRLIQWTSPLFGSTVAYLIPIVAILWGLLDGEPVGWFHLLGMSFILSGVYLSRQGN